MSELTKSLMFARSLVFSSLFGLLLTATGHADERILSFDSDIKIAADGSMTVTETIRVRAEGTSIRRGIYREFPTDYLDDYGNNYVVDFDVLRIRRDGASESWHLERRRNGVRIYLGDANRLLQPGEYTYTITYKTDRQIGFFDEHDELYWNVTGNGWEFLMDVVTATVTLPISAPAAEMAVEGYTGYSGSQGQHYTASVFNGGAMIEATRTLGGGEGLTVVVRWPKGIVAEPSVFERLGYLLSDNVGLLLVLITLLGSAGFLFYAWSEFGRDPQPGVIFAHYEPPEGYSPASARYIRRMGYDNRTLSAAVINLAVKGHLSITQDDDDDYQLNKTSSAQPLAPGEETLLSKLFSSGSILELDDKNHATIAAARKAHAKSLRRDYYDVYFKKNSGLLLPSFVISVVVALVLIFLRAYTPLVVVLLIANLGVHIGFAYLLRAPTSRGRWLLDKLDGFELYLTIAEQADLNLAHPPDKTPELFERYLPFAIALGVEHDWAEQFSEVFAALASEPSAYQPHWYNGNFDYMNVGSFTNDVGGALTTAISSSASPPGSASGGGGGGSSGGGGGGGGGGGW